MKDEASLPRRCAVKLRRRVEERLDQLAVLCRRLFPAQSPPRYDGRPRVSVIAVNFNTLALTKLMLLTMASVLPADLLREVVIVDNDSRDGTALFFGKFGVLSKVRLVAHKGRPTHAAGLRAGIEYLCAIEKGLDPRQQTNLYLIVDSDIIFLRDFLPAALRPFSDPKVGAVGELQYDVGEPYAHPSCLLLRRDVYHDRRIIPFVNHGAPALWQQRSMRRAGLQVVDFPVRSGNYIVHRGRSTVEAVSGRGGLPPKGPHYHGNPSGAELWEKEVAKFRELLEPAKEMLAIGYIDSLLNPRARAGGSAAAGQATAGRGYAAS